MRIGQRLQRVCGRVGVTVPIQSELQRDGNRRIITLTAWPAAQQRLQFGALGAEWQQQLPQLLALHGIGGKLRLHAFTLIRQVRRTF